MKTSTLADCLEEFEARFETLRLAQEPATRVLAPENGARAAGNGPHALRAWRASPIRIRDDGFRPFRVF
jgi:hypothetical protein